jgi:hypothetical protein
MSFFRPNVTSAGRASSGRRQPSGPDQVLGPINGSDRKRASKNRLADDIAQRRDRVGAAERFSPTLVSRRPLLRSRTHRPQQTGLARANPGFHTEFHKLRKDHR